VFLHLTQSNKQNKSKMKIKAIKISDPTITAEFNWNNEMTECDHLAIGVDDNDWDVLMSAKVHEGCDVDGWIVTVQF